MVVREGKVLIVTTLKSDGGPLDEEAKIDCQCISKVTCYTLRAYFKGRESLEC